MAYSSGELRREIQKIVSDLLTAEQKVNRGWLEHDVLSRHPLPLMKDRDFNIFCRRVAVSRAVREVLRDLKLAAEDPESVAGSGTLPLPGYKHLQQGYPIERDGEFVIVPITLLSRQERLQRAELYRKMALGCQEHADELERYGEAA
jgi:hypothetical protein